MAALIALASAPAAGRDGRALYFGAADEPLAAEIAGVPQTGLACSQCHGRDAVGDREGGRRTPPIGQEALAAAETPYDANAFRRALAEGVAPDGRRLSLAMPRFALSEAQAAALWTFLSRAGEEDRAGVAPDAVTIAVLHREAGRDEAEALRAALERRRLEHGPQKIFGREPRFRTISVDADVAALSGAFVGVWASTTRDEQAFRIAAASGLPVIAARAPQATPADVVRLAADPADVERAVLGLTRAGALPLGDFFGADASKVSPERLRVAATPEDLAADPARASALRNSGAEIVVVSPAGDPGDREAYAAIVAAVVDSGLREAGRALARRSFLRALADKRITVSGWPALAFDAQGRKGSAEVRLDCSPDATRCGANVSP